MSSFSRTVVTAAIALALATGTSSSQVPGVSLPPVGLPGLGSPGGGGISGVGTEPSMGDSPVLGGLNDIGTLSDIGGIAGLPGDPGIGALSGVNGVNGVGLAGFSSNQLLNPRLDAVHGPLDVNMYNDKASLLELRRLRLRMLVREYRHQLETDGLGQPVRRGVLVITDPDPRSLQIAVRTGFRILTDHHIAGLGVRTLTVAVPKRMTVRAALKRLRTVAPRINADFDHVYEPAGGSLLPVAGALAASKAAASNGFVGRKIGMIDGGVAAHPSLARSSIEQRGFAGDAQPTGHGTAVASLIVGNHGPFRGAARGSSLLVADVYGGNRAAGSASMIANALGWLANHRPSVINVSLVGPPNNLLARAIGAVHSRGIQVVAAVGNDGPAAPPQFPASYPGVVSITGVDGGGRALPEAGQSTQLDFAAPGADMVAALPGQGYSIVRGTSFASPLAAARLALVGSQQRLALEARPGKGRVGRGIVCANCRVAPKALRAK